MSSRFLNQGVENSRPRHFGEIGVFQRREGCDRIASPIVRDPPPLSFRPQNGGQVKVSTPAFLRVSRQGCLLYHAE